MASLSECVPAGVAPSSRAADGREGSASRPDSSGSDRSFPRNCRLASRRQFLQVYSEGRRASCRCFTLFALPNSLDHSRIGLTVTRKVGGAVTRNKIKRALREVFRHSRRKLGLPMDLVINARATVMKRSPELLEHDLLQCAARVAESFSR